MAATQLSAQLLFVFPLHHCIHSMAMAIQHSIRSSHYIVSDARCVVFFLRLLVCGFLSFVSICFLFFCCSFFYIRFACDVSFASFHQPSATSSWKLVRLHDSYGLFLLPFAIAKRATYFVVIDYIRFYVANSRFVVYARARMRWHTRTRSHPFCFINEVLALSQVAKYACKRERERTLNALSMQCCSTIDRTQKWLGEKREREGEDALRQLPPNAIYHVWMAFWLCIDINYCWLNAACASYAQTHTRHAKKKNAISNAKEMAKSKTVNRAHAFNWINSVWKTMQTGYYPIAITHSLTSSLTFHTKNLEHAARSTNHKCE